MDTAHDRTGAAPGRVATIGHGLLAGEELAGLLAGAGVARLIDVRRTPSSRRNPDANRPALVAALGAAGIAVTWTEALGGRREAQQGSPHVALGDPALRGYADHLGGEQGRAALAALAEQARAEPTAVLCAEGDWRRCHRRLIADALVVVHGLAVVHLRHDGTREPHEVDPRVRAEGGVARWDRAADQPLPGS